MAAQTETFQGRRRLVLLAAAALVVLQAVFFGCWIWREEASAGVTIVVRTVPVDPRDLLRGQYFLLQFEFDSPGGFHNQGVGERDLLPGETIFAALAADAQGLYFPKEYDNSLSRLRRSLTELYGGEPFAGDQPRVVVVQGTVVAKDGGRFFDFGLNRYFVPEGTREPGASQTIEVELKVGKNLTPRIVAVLVDGEPWPKPRGRQ